MHITSLYKVNLYVKQPRVSEPLALLIDSQLSYSGRGVDIACFVNLTLPPTQYQELECRVSRL